MAVAWLPYATSKDIDASSNPVLRRSRPTWTLASDPTPKRSKNEAPYYRHHRLRDLRRTLISMRVHLQVRLPP